ncbi:MAG: hypothetical protein ACR5LF_09160 [Symbiopectobacterium sp.]
MRKSTALAGIGNPLLLESARWQNTHRRIKALLAQSFTLITQECETYMMLQDATG